MTSSDDSSKMKTSSEKSNNLLAKRYIGLEKSIWTELNALPIVHKAIDLGQGFIDYAPPHYFIDLYKETLDDPNIFLHQYTREMVSL
ncbi:unnamed protein product [Rotaria sordida]|uniref:Uncharacterized protein n=1 Tax=Rotaria sordida TaxID=392033 RepID=A0A814B2Q3_9BILA|nr:unnamed protein product [Rotaria sordida]